MRAWISMILSVLLLFFHQFIGADGKTMTGTNQEESRTESSNDYIDNEIDMKLTYRSGIERVLQGLIHTIERYRNTFLASTIALVQRPAGEQQERNDGGFGSVLNQFREDFHAVFPGTLWCGDGNVARTSDEVGLFAQTDSCCREHDNCPYNIGPGQTMGHLKNNGIFTRSACSCDFEFYKCLKTVSTVISANIGATYFNILRPQCFGYHYPIETCEKYDSIRLLEKKCHQYKLNPLQNKTLEWYDLPDF